MSDKRNIGITGSPNSGAGEVFAAILRFGIPPKKPSAVVADSDTTDWGEYGDTEQPPYDAKKRGKLFGKD
jgi:hypothetical protein